MANIKYNNLDSAAAQDLITFTDIPNILSVEATADGTYATFTFLVNTAFKSQTTADGQWWITFIGETITNVLNYKNAVNKNFYVADTAIATAASIARAWRNCPGIMANFDVIHDSSSVILKAKGVGKVWSDMQNYIDYAQGLSTYITMTGTDGSVPDDSLQGALIDVDVYSDGNYITTLEKNWYNGTADFNMSPVLATISEYGRVVPYQFKISSLQNGGYALLDTIDNNYTSIGYMCNQGYKYLSMSGLVVAQNYSRGASRDADNNTILYLYQPQIEVSIYTGNLGGFSYQIDYLDSAFNSIGTYSSTMRCNSYSLLDLTFMLNHSGSAYFPLAFYIDLTLGTTKIRYNVIKPRKMTEYSQRILWRNSYGGISFFDFTGQKSETRSADIMTYQKNIFGYYTDPMNELEKVYNNDVKYTVSLKSHLFENDGKYTFNDLVQSSEVWTEINGERYAIIIDSVSVEETDRNNIYEATVKYHYSQEPSLI